MEQIMDQFLKLYDKDDDPTHGIYKSSTQEVADALGYVKGFDCNGKPYYCALHEWTTQYLVENRDFITVKITDDTTTCRTRF